MQNADQAFFGRVSDDRSSQPDTKINPGNTTRNSMDDKSRFDYDILIVESSEFLRDCLARGANGFAASKAASFASLAELLRYHPRQMPTVVLFSILSLTDEQIDSEFALLPEIDPGLRTMVLAPTDNLNMALTALTKGANGYISMTADFDIVFQALRFVGAGGTYIPAQFLLAGRQDDPGADTGASSGAITGREASVIRAIREGKPNKVIAYELNMCESTVKVHVRNIMKKLKAKNRTEVAIKGEKATPWRFRNMALERDSH
jgi:DNA-binding NarL/FixJ family response regulator